MIQLLSTDKGVTVGPVSTSLCDYRCRTADATDFPEYRSAIFYNSPAQKDIAQKVTEEVQKKHFDPKGTKIVTEITEAGNWYDAEDYHQLFLFHNPTGYQCPTHRLNW